MSTWIIRASARREGEPVFLPQGGNCPYLDHIATVLRGIRDGVEVGKAMFAAFSTLELIQPVTLDIKFDEEHGYSMVGLHGIDRERLAALDGASLDRLNRAGFLEGAYLVLASMQQHTPPDGGEAARCVRSGGSAR